MRRFLKENWEILLIMAIGLAIAIGGAIYASKADAKKSHFGPTVSRRSTGYCPGEASGVIDSKGRRLHWGQVAANGFAYNTLIRFNHIVRIPDHPARRYFRVRDVGAPLDIWMNCNAMDHYGNPTLRFKVVLRPRR